MQLTLKRKPLLIAAVVFVVVDLAIMGWELRRNAQLLPVKGRVEQIEDAPRRKILTVSYTVEGEPRRGQSEVSFLYEAQIGDPIQVLVTTENSDQVMLDQYMYRHQLSFGLAVAALFLAAMGYLSARRLAKNRAETLR